VKFFCLGDELMLRPSFSRLYLGEVRSHPSKVLWFRPQSIRLVLVQLASLIDSSSSWNSGTWTSISIGSGGCRSRCGALIDSSSSWNSGTWTSISRGSGRCRSRCGGGGGGGRSRMSMPTMVKSMVFALKPKLRNEKENKWNASKNMDDNGGPEKELTHWSVES